MVLGLTGGMDGGRLTTRNSGAGKSHTRRYTQSGDWALHEADREVESKSGVRWLPEGFNGTG